LASSFFWQLEPHHGSFRQNWSLVKFSSLSPAGYWKYPPSLAKSVNCMLKAHLKLFFLYAGLPSAPSCLCFYWCDMLLTWLIISIIMTSLPNFVCTTWLEWLQVPQPQRQQVCDKNEEMNVNNMFGTGGQGNGVEEVLDYISGRSLLTQ